MNEYEHRSQDRDVGLDSGREREPMDPIDARPPGKRTLTGELSAGPSAARSADLPAEKDVADQPKQPAVGAAADEQAATPADKPAAKAAPDTKPERTFSGSISFNLPARLNHVCSAACGHMQLARMIMARAEGAGPGIDTSKFQAAVALHNEKRKATFAGGGAGAADQMKGGAAEQGVLIALDSAKGGGRDQQKGGAPGAAPAAPAAPTAPATAPVTPGAGASPAGGVAGGVAAGDSAAQAGTVVPGKPPAGFPDTMGLTTWNVSSYKSPSFSYDASGKDKDWKTKVKTTTSSEGTPTAVATKADTYNIGQEEMEYDEIQPDNKVVKKKIKLTKFVEVSATAAAQIVTAEQEHLNDLTEAYNITYKAIETAINAMVGKDYKGDSKEASVDAAKAALKAAVHTRLTEDPANWGAMMNECANLTISGRDDSGLHKMDTVAEESDYDLPNKKVTFRAKLTGTLGAASNTIVKL